MTLDEQLAELERLHRLCVREDWIADDFCEHEESVTRLGTTDHTDTYYHRTKAIAYFSYDTTGDGERDPVSLLEAESSAKFCALAKNAFPALLAEIKRLRGEGAGR